MRVMNEILLDGEKAYGPEFLARINEVAQRERGQQFRRIEDVVIRPSADLGRLAGQILRNISDTRSRSPLIRLAARNLGGGRGRSSESDLLSYLLFDGEFLAPLAELGYSDAAAREEELSVLHRLARCEAISSRANGC
jgi:NTE family protein